MKLLEQTSTNLHKRLSWFKRNLINKANKTQNQAEESKQLVAIHPTQNKFKPENSKSEELNKDISDVNSQDQNDEHEQEEEYQDEKSNHKGESIDHQDSKYDDAEDDENDVNLTKKRRKYSFSSSSSDY